MDEGKTIILTSKGCAEQRKNEVKIKLKKDSKEIGKEFIESAVRATENLNKWLEEHGEKIKEEQNELIRQTFEKFEETIRLAKKKGLIK